MNILKKYSLALFMGVFLFWTMKTFFLTETNAQDLQFTLTKPVEKKIIIKNIYRFYIMEYDPVIEATPSELKIDKLRDIYRPENIAIAYFSSQAQGNYKWYHSLLSKILQQKVDAELVSSGKTSDDIIKEWQDKFHDAKVELTYRIERGLYSIIHYRIISTLNKNRIIKEEGDIAIGRSHEPMRTWEVIDLEGDPVYENWNFDGTVKVIPKK